MQTAGKRLENFEIDEGMCKQGAKRSKGTQEFQKKEQTARRILKNFESRETRKFESKEQKRSKGTGEFQKKKQTAPMRLQKLERD